MNDDQLERKDRREGCPIWDVTIPVIVTVRGRNAADADHVAREALEQVDATMDLDVESEVRRHEEY